jgi:hypothetical protein
VRREPAEEFVSFALDLMQALDVVEMDPAEQTAPVFAMCHFSVAEHIGRAEALTADCTGQIVDEGLPEVAAVMLVDMTVRGGAERLKRWFVPCRSFQLQQGSREVVEAWKRTGQPIDEERADCNHLGVAGYKLSKDVPRACDRSNERRWRV